MATRCNAASQRKTRNRISSPITGAFQAYRSAAGFGIRLDGGTAYSGAFITRYYDPLLVKVTASGATPLEAIHRMDRALREFRIRGVATNLTFLEAIINHPKFQSNDYTTRFIDTTPELFEQMKRQDRATKLLTYIADVTVNGHPETKGRAKPARDAAKPRVPWFGDKLVADGTKQLLGQLGPKKFAEWMRNEKRALITDTTMRDGHQSLLATRVRTYDIARIANAYAQALPNLFSPGMLGRGYFRRLHALPDRRPVGASSTGARRRAQPPVADASARCERGWLQILSGQCGENISCARQRARALTCSAFSTASTGLRTCACRWMRCWRKTSSVKRRSAIRAIF
ncbi:hypothetical protein VXQ18_05715 [Brucella abortus]|nr:hypothetical protein [Brucella abortus]